MKILTIIFFIIAYLFIGVCIAAIDYVWSSDGYKELVDKDYFGDDWYERLEKVASREWLAFSMDSGQLVVLRASNIVAITSE